MTTNAKTRTTYHRTPLVIWAVGLALVIAIGIAGPDRFYAVFDWTIHAMRLMWDFVVGAVGAL